MSLQSFTFSFFYFTEIRLHGYTGYKGKLTSFEKKAHCSDVLRDILFSVSLSSGFKLYQKNLEKSVFVIFSIAFC